jgi:hypothetical protein
MGAVCLGVRHVRRYLHYGQLYGANRTITTCTQLASVTAGWHTFWENENTPIPRWG